MRVRVCVCGCVCVCVCEDDVLLLSKTTNIYCTISLLFDLFIIMQRHDMNQMCLPWDCGSLQFYKKL